MHMSLTTIVNKDDEVLGMIITNLSEQKELERDFIYKRGTIKKE